jgi:sugar lactone lactonase YvrE
MNAQRMDSWGRFGVTVILAAVVAAGLGSFATGAAQAPAGPAPGTPAPEFPPDAPWLNTGRPLTLRGLNGKVVLLDFWTYGCINCMHVIPDLKRLEAKYPRELVVVSVHTAKFPNEDVTQNIRNAALRYGIDHPILNDNRRIYWETLRIGVWPTFVLIDPAGRIVGSVAGEGHYETLDRAIGNTIRTARAAGILDTRPLRFTLESVQTAPTPLRYPGKVLADTAPGGSGRIYIADTAHHRIVIVDEKGEVQAIAGSGAEGRQDGPFDSARFSSPQGMAMRRMPDGALTLLVADTNNHSIRALDLTRRTVSTIAGTGMQASVRRPSPGGPASRTPIASPWDLLLVGDQLYVAMAGPHQIWTMNLKAGTIYPYAGSAKEARTDGPRLAAAFAQPSGLATDGKRLFVADSEASAIRAVDLPAAGGNVRTLVFGDLFDFGDRDGPGTTARLQHPLGVAYADGILYIADTYNHKLKQLDLASGVVSTLPLAGGGAAPPPLSLLPPGTAPPAAAAPARLFYEPGGISLVGRKLYVADTNHHRIQVVDLDRRSVSTLPLKNLKGP